MSSTRNDWQPSIGERELTRLTEEMAEAHRATLPLLRAETVGLTDRIRARNAAGDAPDGPTAPARRRFLLGAGGAGVALALSACSGGKALSSTTARAARSQGDPSDRVVVNADTYTGDLRTVALSAALENQAVGAYRSAVAAGKAGRLGTVPPAVASFVVTAMAQHADHAKAWNAVLTGAGKPPVTGVPLSNQQQVDGVLGNARNVGTVLMLALQLEEVAAQTYVSASYHVKNIPQVNTAASIAPVEAMHAAILRFVLGQYPVKDTFLPVGQAAKTSLLTF